MSRENSENSENSHNSLRIQELLWLEMGQVLWKSRRDCGTDRCSGGHCIQVIELTNEQARRSMYVCMNRSEWQQQQPLWRRIQQALACDGRECDLDVVDLLKKKSIIVVMGHETLVDIVPLKHTEHSDHLAVTLKQSELVYTYALSEIAKDSSLKREAWRSLQHALVLMKGHHDR